MADPEKLKWFWQQTYDSEHRAKILESVAAVADAETLKWFWEQTYDSKHRAKILEGVAARADAETLKWFWEQTYDSEHRAKILEGVAARADAETLKWFWEQTYDSKHRAKILASLVRRTQDPLQSSPATSAGQKRNSLVDSSERYDVFISHASEDKDAIARPLYTALTAAGVTVWFDEAALEIGDSLRGKIDQGLARCRYGVVILSPTFFAKQWPQRELDGLVARETASGEKAILPVWHDLERDDVIRFSPTLADRLAARSNEGIGPLVEKILRVLKPH